MTSTAPVTSTAPSVKPPAAATTAAPSAKPPATSPPAASTSAPSEVCSGAKELEPNDSWAKANKLAGSACAELNTQTDADWYAIAATPGAHTLEVTSAADVALTVGVVSGANCVTSLSNAKRINVTVGGATQNLCVKANSATGKLQPYRLIFN